MSEEIPRYGKQKRARGRRYAEAAHQAFVVGWAKWQASRHLGLELLHAIPNQLLGYMGRRYCPRCECPIGTDPGRMIGQGIVAGMPDLHLPVPRLYRALNPGERVGLWIEMKSATGSPSAQQRERMATLRALGHEVVVCRSGEEAKAAIEDYYRGIEGPVATGGAGGSPISGPRGEDRRGPGVVVR